MSERQSEVRGEHSLREGEIDRLGFAEVANRIAKAITDRASRDGLVIGLDGEWGSGKSSLLFLVEKALEGLPDDEQPTLISFRPWLVGNREALLSSLFSELAEKIADASLKKGDATKVSLRKAKRTAKALKKFAQAIGTAGALVEAAGKWWSPLEPVGALLSGVQKLFNRENESDLSSLKKRLIDDLRDLDHRFIVTIDDVDRLEPAEVVEVLRLVRSVADFPNIIYILCYDSERLAEAIQRGAKVENGLHYLEKMIQLTVMIPKPEPFALRQWFAEDLQNLVGLTSGEVRERLRTVIDQEGGVQLRTPRSVVRTLDSIRFFWPAMRKEELDVADLVWLQLIKDGSPKLYRWVEDYVASVSATTFGTVTVPESDKAARLIALLECGTEGQFKDDMYAYFFADLLPGVEAALSGDEDRFYLHGKLASNDIERAISSKRLASPDHYRLYFSLIGPSHAITKENYERFWNAARIGADDTAKEILHLHGQVSLGSLTKSDVLFERLHEINPENISSEGAAIILLGLGEVMDDIYRGIPDQSMFFISSWDRAERLVPRLYGRIDSQSRSDTIKALFGTGKAIGWLTSIFRRETFAHGRFGDQKRPKEKWYLSEADFDIAMEQMLSRYRSMTIEEIIATPRPLGLLFAWSQASDEGEPRELITAAVQSDKGLVEVLMAMLSTIDSSDRGRFQVLKKENVEPFIDFSSARERLEIIARSNDTDLAAKARMLVGAAKDALDD